MRMHTTKGQIADIIHEILCTVIDVWHQFLSSSCHTLTCHVMPMTYVYMEST